MRLIHREAERFERALAEGATTEELASLVAEARALVAVGAYAGSPRPEFVLTLRDRLVAEAAELPARPAPARATTTAPARPPTVILVGRGLPRAIAGLAATVLAVGGIVGAASQSALPGGTLYPVRGFLDGVAVQLSGSDYDRGVTGLDQAWQDLVDVRTLASKGEADTGLYADTLTQSASSTNAATDHLLADYRANSNPQALVAITDFVGTMNPLAEAAGEEVPGSALPALGLLKQALAEAERRATVTLAACAPTCISTEAVADLIERAGGIDAVGGIAALGGTSVLEALGLDGGGTPDPDQPVNAAPTPSSTGPVVTVPGAPVSVDTSTPGGGSGQGSSSGSGGGSGGSGSSGSSTSPPISVGTGSGGVVVDVGGGGATVGTGGVTVNGPTVPVLPSVGVTLPSITLGGSGLGVQVPDQTLGGIVLPGLGVDLPGAKASSD